MSDAGLAIHSGLDFLAGVQRQDGGFVSYSSPFRDDFSRARRYRTVFAPALILSSLACIDTPQSKAIRQHLADYVVAQRSEHWSFHYWDHASWQAQTMPYPDDLDDTFAALSALRSHDKSIIDAKVLAAITRLLIAAESKAGGPYRTWLVDESAPQHWHDIDVAVNANIAFFLSQENVTLPNVTAFVEQAIESGNISSPYYPDSHPIIYFIARWYRGDLQDTLRDMAAKLPRDNPLHTALAVSARLRLGEGPQALAADIAYLLRTQQANGSWRAQAFCIDPALENKGMPGKKQTHYAGSPALTTAFCLEALQLYDAAARPASPRRTHKNREYEAVTSHVSDIIEALESPELRRSVHDIFETIIKRDRDKQIILLPWLVNKMADTDVPVPLMRQLALVSLWGWMAYTVYDDFLDGEGDPRLLPGANVCLRQVANAITQTLPDNADFQAEAADIMNRLDAANAWEVAHCRVPVAGSNMHIAQLPDYGDLWQLAERSLGHTIAGLGVLYGAGYGRSSRQLQAMRDFFRHYLIARQLNDDAHDWQEDLQAGHINAVTVRILEKHGKCPGTIDLALHGDSLRLIMWEQVIDDVCELIHSHVNKARAALDGGGFAVEPVAPLLDSLAAAADQARKTRDEALQFLEALK